MVRKGFLMSGRPDGFITGGKPHERIRKTKPVADDESARNGWRDSVSAGAGRQNSEAQSMETVRIPIRWNEKAEAQTGQLGGGRGAQTARAEQPALTRTERLMRWAGTKYGARWCKQREKKMGTQSQTYAVSTGVGKGVKQAIISAGVLVAGFGVVRGLAPGILWPEDQDAEIAGRINEAITAIVGAVTALSFLVGVIKNVWKNWGLVKTGVTATKLGILLCAGLLAFGTAGCVTHGMSQNMVDAQVQVVEEALARCVDKIYTQDAAIDAIQGELAELAGDKADNENAFAGADVESQADFERAIEFKERELEAAQHWRDQLQQQKVTIQNTLRDLNALSDVRNETGV